MDGDGLPTITPAGRCPEVGLVVRRPATGETPASRRATTPLENSRPEGRESPHPLWYSRQYPLRISSPVTARSASTAVSRDVGVGSVRNFRRRPVLSRHRRLSHPRRRHDAEGSEQRLRAALQPLRAAGPGEVDGAPPSLPPRDHQGDAHSGRRRRSPCGPSSVVGGVSRLCPSLLIGE